MIATGKEGSAPTPNTLNLALSDQHRRATVTFRGVTRATLTDGGLLNIVNAIEVLKPDSETHPLAMRMLQKSAHFGKRRAELLLMSFQRVGVEIAVELDSLSIESA